MKRLIIIETTLDGKYCGEACEFMYGDRCNLFGAFLDHEGRQKIRCYRCKQSGALAKDIEDQWRKGVENNLKADFRLGESDV